MNPETSSKLNQLLDFLLSSVKEGKEVVLDQLPKLAREILAWKFYEAGIDLILSVIGGIVILYLAYRLYKFASKERDRYSDDTSQVFACIGTIIASVFGGILIIVSTYTDISTMVKVRVAPRLVILEEVKGMITPPVAK